MTITDSRPTTTHAATIAEPSDATNSRRAEDVATPIKHPPVGPDSLSTQAHSVPKGPASSGATSPAAICGPSSALTAPQGTKTTGGQASQVTQEDDAAGSGSGPAAEISTASTSGSLLDPALSLAADVLDDIERVRIANQNRLRQLTRTGEDIDGEERGFGLDPDHPDVMRLGLMVLTLEKVEHDATLELQRKLRKHPLGVWVKAQRGVGEKQGARLLAAIGDPYINSSKGTPRTVSALWAYCGLHVLPGGPAPSDHQTPRAAGDQHRDADPSAFVGVAAKRRKGERANWSTKAKMRAYLIAESCMKQLSPDCRDGHQSRDIQWATAVPVQDPQVRSGHACRDAQTSTAAPACACSPYRVVYDQRRAHTASTHPEWTDGHSHNDALRVASKAILRDLWRAARDWHIANGDDS